MCRPTSELNFFISYKTPGIRTTLVCPGHILTPLFATISFPQNRLFKFFFPSIQPIDVVKPIITALDAQESQTILLPFYVHMMPYLNLLPSFVGDLAQYVSGTLWTCFTLGPRSVVFSSSRNRLRRRTKRCQTLPRLVAGGRTRVLYRFPLRRRTES